MFKEKFSNLVAVLIEVLKSIKQWFVELVYPPVEEDIVKNEVSGIIDGEIIPKNRKTFQGRLANTTIHMFREIRYGYPKNGELRAGGGSPAGDNCAVWEYRPSEYSEENKSRSLICELID